MVDVMVDTKADRNVAASLSTADEEDRSKIYPKPLIFESEQSHDFSLIILHGRGFHARQFGPPLLSTQLPDGETLRAKLPNARFIFPTASFRKSAAVNNFPVIQWFDVASLKDPETEQDLQVEGLRESAQFVHTLVQQEVDLVGAQNVYIGGLSQGCAAALISLAVWTGPALGGAFGMSGWLPMQSILMHHHDAEDNLANGNAVLESGNQTKSREDSPRLQSLFDKLEIEFTESTALFNTPIFIGHGCDDKKVSIDLGLKAADTFRHLGCLVEWKAYENLGHWYHGLELEEIVDFIERSRNR